MERSLAHIEQITNIRPIDGCDNIVQCNVLGWNLIIKKDEFKDGDKCVYIEIDSIAPLDMECFSFLEKKHYKIKTMKMRGVISQGLALPLSVLPPKEYNIGDDVTQILRIKKIEDEVTESKPINKEMIFKQKHKKLATNKFVKYFMKYNWFRNIMFRFFVPKKKKNKFPAYVVKTDENRLQGCTYILEKYKDTPMVATEKCVSGTTVIKTLDGSHLIRDIVNNNLNILVASFNVITKKVEYKKILDYHKIPQNDLFCYKIGVGCKGKGNRPKFIRCTENHKFLVDDCWVEAKDLKIGDKLSHFSNKFPNEAKEMILGCLLGDSSINANSESGNYRSIHFGQSEKQEDYLRYKEKLLGEYAIGRKEHISGYGSNMKLFHTKANLDLEKYINSYCLVNNKKTVTKQWCDDLTPISLAFWYMDDGNIKNRENENIGCRANLNTQGFSLDECQLLQNALLRFNINSTIGDKDIYKGYIIILDVLNTEKFCSLIAPYVCDSMKYKLPKKYQDLKCFYEDYTFDTYNGVVDTKILSIEKLPPKSFGLFMYDITIEDNANYFANSILVHNCDGTSTTFALERLGKKKFDFAVCSRNVRQESENRKCFYDSNVYWEIAFKYNVEDVLKDLIQGHNTVVLQGETIGEGIQKNKYNIKGVDFYAFNLIFDGKKIDSLEGKKILEKYGIKWVPIVEENFKLLPTVDEMIAFADGKSKIYDTLREGLVIRDSANTVSFKCISNKFLIKHDL